MRSYLIVDDNLPFAENLAEILRDRGDEVTVAESPAQALTLVKSTHFHAVLTDMRMPAMSGADLVHELRLVDPGLAALVISAYTGDAELERARHEGVLAVLPKPVPLPRLMELLASARRDGMVAVLEDDPALSDNLGEVLRSHGFSSVIAGSVTQASELGPRPFVALVDLRLPGGSDGEAGRRFGERFPTVPLLLITAFGEVPPAFPYQQLFTKPFKTEDLLKVIESIHRDQEPRG